jgi:hypothetical protein
MSKTIDLKIFNPYKADGLQRIGNTRDGGYVVHFPSLQYVECLMNYGVGYDVAFEKEFNKITNKPVYAFDPTMEKLGFFIRKIKNGQYLNTLKQVVSLLLWKVNKRKLSKYNIRFIQEGIGARNTDLFKSFAYHLSKYDLSNKKIFLKIDIEGAEFEIFSDPGFYNSLNNVIQLVVEFHYAGKNLEKINEIITKLSNTHSLIHIHGNNIGGTFTYEGKQIPEVFEVTFLHNSFLPEKILSALNYPIKGLDYPCNKKQEDIKLNFFQ